MTIREIKMPATKSWQGREPGVYNPPGRPKVTLQLRIITETEWWIRVRRAGTAPSAEVIVPRSILTVKQVDESHAGKFVVVEMLEEIAKLHRLVDPEESITVLLYMYDQTGKEVLLSEYHRDELDIAGRRDARRWIPIEKVVMREIDPDRGRYAVTMNRRDAEAYCFETAPKPESENVAAKN